MNRDIHKETHKILHEALDKLVADWIKNTGKLPSKSSILELMQWSNKQLIDPDES